MIKLDELINLSKLDKFIKLIKLDVLIKWADQIALYDVIKPLNKKISYYLDAIIGVLALCLLLVIFVPQSIWSDEVELKEECQVRMENLYELEIEFYRLVGRFPNSPQEAMTIVLAVMESAKMDTGFFGAETLMIDTSVYFIDTQGDMVARVDTLMSMPISDLLFSCPLAHERYRVDIENNRTIYIACPIKQELNPFKIVMVEPDDSLRNLYSEVIDENKYEIRSVATLDEASAIQEKWMPELVIIDDRVITASNIEMVDKMYENDEDALVLLMMLEEPDTTGKIQKQLPIVNGTVPYSFTLGDLKDKVDEVVLETPRRWLREDYEKSRYLFFTMIDSIHGYIEDGDRSWVAGDN